jgi:hypothetical protein
MFRAVDALHERNITFNALKVVIVIDVKNNASKVKLTLNYI